jgi:hydroxyacylglutathione hydrolase
VVDVREPIDFAGAHLAGSLNISLEGKYATWAGTMLKKDKPIVVVADGEHREEAIMRLGRIGFDQVLGYLADGPEALQPRPELTAKVERITALALGEQLHLEVRPLVLDVRTENEYRDGHIEGSTNIPLNHLEDRVTELPEDEPIVVHCKSGYRSSIAASVLQRHGRKYLMDLVGGFDAWKASQLPVAVGQASSLPVGS